MLIIPANSASAAGGFDVANSCRFDGSSSYLHKTPTNAGNRLKYTFSTWVKKSKIAGEQIIFTAYASNTNHTYLRFKTTGEIRYRDVASDSTNGQLVTSAKFRDPSAWLNVVLVVDEENSTSGNRLILYVNGLRVTQFSTETMPTAATTWNSADVKMEIGVTDGGDGDDYFSGYMAETVFIDGSALAPTDFGEFDEDSGIWKPIKVSGLTFGTNGFYLDFKEASNLGNDANGGTDFTEVGLAAIDQSTDTCTNNFCTWNPLDTFYNTMTFQEGNTQGTKPNSTVESYGTSTFGITSGKWYAEFKVISFSGSNSTIGFGIIDRVAVQNDKEIGKHTYGISYKSNGDVFSADGNLLTNQGTLAANDIIGLYIDIDNLKFYFAKNGTIANSGTGLAIPALTSTLNGVYFFGFDNFQAGGSIHQANWGNPAYTGTDKSDANGFGSFEYDPSSGTFDSASKDFLALCTKNLAEYGG